MVYLFPNWQHPAGNISFANPPEPPDTHSKKQLTVSRYTPVFRQTVNALPSPLFRLRSPLRSWKVKRMAPAYARFCKLPA